MVGNTQQTDKVRFAIPDKTFKCLFLSLIIGSFGGILIVFDPMLANTFDIDVHGGNLLKLYPYEISSLFLFFVLLFFFAKRLFPLILFNFEKAAIIIVLVTSQTIALHRMGAIDGNDLAIGIIFICFFIRVILKNEKFSFTLFDLLNLSLMFFIFLASFNGQIITLIKASFVFKFVMLSFLLSNLLYKTNLSYFFLKWLTITVAISSAIAIVQEILYITTGLVLVGFIEAKELQFMFEATSFGTFLRVPGFMSNYKAFAFLLMTNILLILNYYLYYPPKDYKVKVYSLIASCLMFTALLLTFSKDSILALSVVIIFSFMVRWPNLIIHFIAGFLIILLAIYFVGLHDDIYNLISREIHWGEWRMRIQLNREGINGFISNQFLAGRGFSTGSKYTRHFLGWPAHNNIILAAGEIGILGLFSYLLVIGHTAFKILIANLTVKDIKDKAIARGLLFSLISLLIALQFHAGYIDIVLWMYMGVIQGVVLLFKNKKTDAELV